MKLSRLSALSTALIMLLNVMLGLFAQPVYAADDKVEVTVHYYRIDGNYDSWNLWTWIPELAGTQQLFTEEDSFGKVAKYTLDNTNNQKQVGLIVRKGEWQMRDGDIDRFADIKDGKVEVWLVQGELDVFDSEEAAKEALIPKLKGASMVNFNQVQLRTNLKMNLTGKDHEGIVIKQGEKEIEIESVVNPNAKTMDELGYEIQGDKIHFVLKPGTKDVPKLDAEGSSKVFIAGTVNGWNGSGDPQWALTWNEEKKYYEMTKDLEKDANFGDKFKFINVIGETTEWMNGSDLGIEDQNITNIALITTKENLSIDQIYTVTKEGFKGESNITLGDALLSSKEFEEKFAYEGNDLGVAYSKEKTMFKLWAPFAEKVTLVTYKDGDIASEEKGKDHEMKKEEKGVWSVTLEGDQNGVFYTYKVTNTGVEKEVGDPYAKAVGINGDRSAVIDLSKTNPQGFDKDKKPTVTTPENMIVYETHIRDLSIHKDSGVTNKGKYIQFKEKETKGPEGVTTGIAHLKELGITHVQIMPSYDYDLLDEKKFDTKAYNWGYDPKNYNVPEGSYSTDAAKPEVRVNEYKQMVQALHDNGIGVIMDVVYNHTYANAESKFHQIAPGYYYRMNEDGSFKNGSGCGSETASERAMMRKYIVDSVKYWASEYHVDGFRFDLMGIHDVETMNIIKEELKKINPEIIIYGEGWDMGNLPREQRALQPHASRMLGIGFFNDNIRDNIKGPWNNAQAHGFVDGKQNYELEIMQGVVGSISYNKLVKDYNVAPTQSINYVSVHDNNTLWDKLTIANPKATEEEKIKMHKMANTIVLTSQGVPLLHAGVDFLRTKYDAETKQFAQDSVRHPDAVNQLDWARKAKYMDVFEYYKGIIAIRNSHPAFRMAETSQIKGNLTFLDAPENTVAFILKDNANKDDWKNIIVIHNANKEEKEVIVPEGNWNVVVQDGKAGVETITTVKGDKVTVSPVSSFIMYTNDDVTVKDLFADKKVIKGQVNSNKVQFNGKEVEVIGNLVEKEEGIYLPARSIAEIMGAEVTFDGVTKEVSIQKGDKAVIISLADFSVKQDAEVIEVKGDAFLTEGKLMIPSNVIEKAFGAKVFADYRRYNEDTTRADDTAPDVYILFN